MNDNTDALLNTRTAVYGDRQDNMRRVALIWSGLTGFPFEAWMIPQLMSAYKKFRTFQTPDYSDNVDDDEGWLRMFREQMAADGRPIIEARTVEEYEAKKNPPVQQTQQPEFAISEDELIHLYGTTAQREALEQNRPKAITLPNGLVVSDGALIDQYSRNRCGYDKSDHTFCMKATGHPGECDVRG